MGKLSSAIKHGGERGEQTKRGVLRCLLFVSSC
jgi:hypothetical protein